jgi:sterol desaturase/sphingolipid hydroxylase (fatty acid hydroxylase superfamily)
MHAIAYTLVFVAFAVIFTIEVIVPASRANCDRRWMILAGALNLTQMVAALVAGYLFRAWFANVSLFGLGASINPFAGGLLVFLVASFIAYWWHRAAHASNLLWRVFHQLHHAPARVESLTAFYAHPFDSIAATFISCATAYLIFGLDAASAAIALLLVSLFNLYIHSDTRSPRWLGLIVQRPEMHRVHHRRGHHADNFGLPVWDLLFGTWRNPREPVELCGFDLDKAARIGDMLLTRDVHATAAVAPGDADRMGAGP